MSWDTTNLQSPHQNLLPTEDYLPAYDLLVKAYQLVVNIEAKEASIDGFIDEIITITIDDPHWVERNKNTVLLIIHTIFIPWISDKPLKQDEPLSLHKITGEGQLAERNTSLGWDIQNRSLRVFLP